MKAAAERGLIESHTTFVTDCLTHLSEEGILNCSLEKVLGMFDFETVSLTPPSLNNETIGVSAEKAICDLFNIPCGIEPRRLSNVIVQKISDSGILEILKLMGANIEIENEHEVGGEPVADLRVRYAPLKGIAIPENLVPLAIDEFPVLFVAASCAEGETLITGAQELRVKESDRIQSMVDGLTVLGGRIIGTPDGAIVSGGGPEFRFSSGAVEACEDHRIAMAFTVAGLLACGPVRISDCVNVATSFPNFVELAREVGFPLTVSE